MRNLKRVLSLVMACAMMLSLMVFTASAAETTNSVDFTDRDEITNIEAVDILVTLGVIDGKDDGSFDPTGIVTRAEMAKLIAVVLNGGEDPLMGSEATTLYTDTTNHWARAYIAYCTNLGIISGRGDGTFDPEATVTGVEAAKMMLTALGYDADVFGFTGAGWDAAVNVQANSAKLYAGVDSSNISAGMTRDNVAQLIYNGLNALVMEKTYDKVLSNGEISYNYILSDYKTLMYTAMGAYRIEGIVEANECADITANAGEAAMLAGKTSVRVTNADEIDKLNDAGGRTALNITGAGPYTFEVSTDMSVLGQKVVFYARPSNTSNATTKATVLGNPVISSDSASATTTSKLKDADAFTDFLKDNGMKVGTGSDAPDYIYNYAQTADFDTNARGVELTAVDWDTDGYVDILMKVEYGLDKVEVVNESKETVTFTDANSGKVIDMDDIVTDLELAEEDIVLIAAIADKYYVVEPETIVGTASKYDNNSNLTIDGTEYAPSEVNNGTDLSTVAGGGYTNTSTEATFYLDLSGNIIAADETSDLTAQNIAYVADVNGTDNYNSSYDAYVYLPDGTKGVYDIVSYNSSSKAADIGDLDGQSGLYAYTLTDNGIALKDASDNSIDSAKYTFTLTETGDASVAIDKDTALHTIDSTDVYFTSDTVFYLKDTTKSVSSGMKTVTGLSNVADQSFDKVVVAYMTNTSGRNIALAVYAGVDTEIDTAVSTATVFVPSTNWATVDATEFEIDVIFTGDEETTTITADAKYPVGLYNYSQGSDGVYTFETPNDFAFEGLLEVVSNTLYVGGEQVNDLSDGLIFDATDSGNIGLAGSSFIKNNAYGYAATDKDNNLLAVYVVNKYEVDPTDVKTFSAGTGVESDPFVLDGVTTIANIVSALNAVTDLDLTAGTSGTPVLVENKGALTGDLAGYDLIKVSGKDDDGYTITTMWFAATTAVTEESSTADVAAALQLDDVELENFTLDGDLEIPADRKLTVTGTLTLNGYDLSGEGTVDAGTIVLGSTISGTLTITADAAEIKGDFEITGGTLTIANSITSEGTYTLTVSGGTLTVEAGTIEANLTVSGEAVVAAEGVKVDGNVTNNGTGEVTTGAITGETEGTVDVKVDLDAVVEAALAYEYDPEYTPYGSFEYADGTITYTATHEKFSASVPAANESTILGATADLARFLGALYYIDDGASVKSITFNDTEYTWKADGPQTGSNWYNNETTLVSAAGLEMAKTFVSESVVVATEKDGSYTFAINGETVTLNIHKDAQAGG